MTDNLVPINPHYDAYATAAGLFLCPSDSNTDRVISENNYRCNYGGSTPFAGCSQGDVPCDPTKLSRDGFPAGGNGAFTYGKTGLKARRFTDGLSKTAFFSERTKGNGNPLGSQDWDPNGIAGLGQGNTIDDFTVDSLFTACENFSGDSHGIFHAAGRWASLPPPDGDWSNGWPFAGHDATQYNHVAPPNWGFVDCGTNSYVPDSPFEHAILSARSQHPGVVVVAFGDGHTDTVADGIDLATWRALGSRNGEEAVGDDF